MNTIPFSKQQLILKQVNLSMLTKPGQDVMQHLFGQFAVKTMSVEESSQASKRVAEILGQTPDKLKAEIDETPSRRYSGDETLPRGRYYSLARDLSGNDDYTLLNELRAYAMPDEPGYFEMYDLTIPSDRDYIKNFFEMRCNISYNREDVLLIGLLPLYGRSHKLVEKWSNTQTKDDIPLTIFVEIPLTIKKETIDKIIDLRDPSTANWFAKEISTLKFNLNNKPTKCFFLKPSLKNFRELIPTLLEQNLGGGWNFCKVAGYYLRQLNANGLIYPSARCDVRVDITNNKLESSRGWNFVDYRGAEKTRNWVFFDISTDWPSIVTFSQPLYGDVHKNLYYEDVAIHFAAKGKKKGSWSVEQLQQRQEAWFQTMMIKNILQFRGAELFDKIFPAIAEFLLGQPTGAFHFGTADAIVNALRGDPYRLHQLVELTQRLTRKDQEIKEALLHLVDSTVKVIEETREKAQLGDTGPIGILQTGQ